MSIGLKILIFLAPGTIFYHFPNFLQSRMILEGSAHRILFAEIRVQNPMQDPSGWTIPRGRPQVSWLCQAESYLRDMGMTGLASAWAMARRRPGLAKEYRRKVDAATHCSGVWWPKISAKNRAAHA